MEQTDAEEPPTQWSELPPEILTNILSRVEQGFRLHCAQVSKGWSSAAALATTAINIDFLVHPQALRRWMSAHGSQITQLRVLGSTVLRRDNVPKALRALPPIQKLQRLELGRSAGTPSWNFLMVISNRMCKDLAQATSLTLLELSCVSVSYKGADLLPAALALLPRLRHLGLRDVLAPAHPQHNALTGGTLTQIEWPADLLLDHPGLTHLKLSGGTEGGALWSLVDLSATLQHLELSNFDASSESYLEDLQCLQALTFLALDGSGRGGEFDDSPAMFLGELTALRHLDLRAFESSEIYEDLQFLSGLTCLLLYDMEGSIWHHHTPTSSLVLLPALQHLVVRSLVPDPLYNRLLWSLDLAAFGAGKQLTHVHIEGYKINGVRQPPNPQLHTPLTAWLSTANSAHKIAAAALAHSPPTFAPLTASSTLQSLCLSVCDLGRHWEHADAAGELLTARGAGCWQQMFRPTQQLLALTELFLLNVRPLLCADDLQALVRGCPALHSLNLTGTLPEGALGAELYALADLTALASLSLSQPDEDACEALSYSSDLECLIIHDPSLITGRGLRELADLQMLTSLGFVGHFSAGHVSWLVEEQMSDTLPGCCMAIVGDKVRPGSDCAEPMCVWEWLYELCQRNVPRRKVVRHKCKCRQCGAPIYRSGRRPPVPQFAVTLLGVGV